MRSEIVRIEPQATLREAAEMMLTTGVDTLWVMEGEQLVGVVGLRDLFTVPVPASYASRMHEWRSEGQLVEAWRGQQVSNIMAEQVLTVPEDLPLLRAASLMIGTGKHPLPVMREGRIVGVLERSDVVRALLALPVWPAPVELCLEP